MDNNHTTHTVPQVVMGIFEPNKPPLLLPFGRRVSRISALAAVIAGIVVITGTGVFMAMRSDTNDNPSNTPGVALDSNDRSTSDTSQSPENPEATDAAPSNGASGGTTGTHSGGGSTDGGSTTGGGETSSGSGSSGSSSSGGSSSGGSSGSNFVTVCGYQLCLNGNVFKVHGATSYGQYDNAANQVAVAKQAGVNVLEIVQFETQYHSLADTMSEATWTRIDQFIATVKQNGLHVILNLSSYGQSLQAAGQTPTTTDWNTYLSFIANRTNTVTGVKYKNEPTIAKVALFGEIDAPNYNIHPGTQGTTAEMTAFFQRTLAQWKSLAPNILVSTGGFSYINDPGSGIEWQTIMADPNNATCDVEVNSNEDRTISVPNVASYCQQIGKPWFLAAWSACYSNPSQGYNYYTSDNAMAAHAQDMYNLAAANAQASPRPAMAAIGTNFWNLGHVSVYQGTCDIGPQFPTTFGTISANAPS